MGLAVKARRHNVACLKRRCLICDTTFDTSRTHARFCSAKCKQKHHRDVKQFRRETGIKPKTLQEQVKTKLTYAENMFNVAWKLLAEEGKCDGFGGAEYRRILALWLASGKKLRPANFIRGKAKNPAFMASAERMEAVIADASKPSPAGAKTSKPSPAGAKTSKPSPAGAKTSRKPKSLQIAPKRPPKTKATVPA